MRRLYTAAISVPVTSIHLRPATVGTGIGFALIAGALGALGPSLLASRVQPAAAMRGEMPAAGTGGRSLAERLVPPLRVLPARWLMVLRGVGRNPRRMVSTVMGTSLALVLVLVAWGMIDTVQVLLDRQFRVVQRHDAEVVWSGPVSDGVLAAVSAVPGMAEVEPTAVVDAVLEAGGSHYETSVQAFLPGTSMHTFVGADGRQIELTGDRMLLGIALRSRLGVSIGDEVRVIFPGTGEAATAEIGGFVDEPLGTFAYVTLDELNQLTGAETASSSPLALVRDDPAADPEIVHRNLQSLPDVAAVRDARSLYETARSFMGLFYAFVGVMLAFGGVMAFALIIATVSANVSEREVEMATLLASGADRGLLERLLAAENMLLVLIGIPVGLVSGYLVAAGFMSSFSSDLFQFDLHMRASTLAWAGLSMAAALVSLWPARRSIRRLEPASVVRRRAL